MSLEARISVKKLRDPETKMRQLSRLLAGNDDLIHCYGDRVGVLPTIEFGVRSAFGWVSNFPYAEGDVRKEGLVAVRRLQVFHRSGEARKLVQDIKDGITAINEAELLRLGYPVVGTTKELSIAARRRGVE